MFSIRFVMKVYNECRDGYVLRGILCAIHSGLTYSLFITNIELCFLMATPLVLVPYIISHLLKAFTTVLIISDKTSESFHFWINIRERERERERDDWKREHRAFNYYPHIMGKGWPGIPHLLYFHKNNKNNNKMKTF